MKTGSFRSQRKHLTDIISPIPVSTNRTRAPLRHSTTIKSRPKMVHFDGSIEIDDSPISYNPNPAPYTLEKIPQLGSNISIIQRYSNSITSQKDSAVLSPELPRRTRLPRKEKSAESRVAVNELLDRCRDFHADKSLSK